MKKGLLLAGILAAINVYSQTSNLHGTVIDEKTNEPLAGATVLILGTTIGTQSNHSGEFNLLIPNNILSDSLIITFIGYRKYGELVRSLINTRNVLIRLKTEATLLKEVIVRSEYWRKRYTPAQLKEDYKTFCMILEKVHTGLFDYITMEQWQSMKDSSLLLCENSMSHSEFFRLIALHVARIRNIHTRYGVTDSWIRQKQNIFPFNVKYFGDKLFVSQSLTDNLKIPRGSEIIEINGRSPIDIKTMIWPYIPADGFIQTSKLADLSDYFAWYFSLFVEEAETFVVRLRTPDGKEQTITSNGFRESFSRLFFLQDWKNKKSSLELQIIDTLRTAFFRIEDSRVFKDSLKVYFQRVVDRKVNSLVIDLRGRGGIREGEQVAELYSYFVNKPFYAYERIEVKSNDYTLFDKDFTYKPYANSLNQIKTQFFDKLTNAGGGYLWMEDYLKKPNPPAPIQFTGKVYILVDGRNYSASTSFASLASQLENVFVVGEETGGEYRSYVSGAMFGLVLPHSKIGVKVATWKSTLAIPENPANKGRGVIPDFPISNSIQDLLDGMDVAMDYVIELVKKNK